MAGERLMSISQDERERAVFRSRRMAETDARSNLATARDIGWSEGMQEGIQKGRQEGRQEGWHESRQEMARLMIANGELDDKIMQYTGLSRDEIKKLRI